MVLFAWMYSKKFARTQKKERSHITISNIAKSTSRALLDSWNQRKFSFLGVLTIFGYWLCRISLKIVLTHVGRYFAGVMGEVICNEWMGYDKVTKKNTLIDRQSVLGAVCYHQVIYIVPMVACCKNKINIFAGSYV